MATPLITATDNAGKETVVYAAHDYQVDFHTSNAPNLLALGERNTGKSLMLRMHAVMLCLMYPNFQALILRRTMPELRKSHLATDRLHLEMQLLGGKDKGYIVVMNPIPMAKFPNGSQITFGHCETEADILSYLSSEYGFIGFDELVTFTLEQFLMISASCRAPKAAPYHALVRAGSNTLGPGAVWMKAWFVDKDVDPSDFPDYAPDDFIVQYSHLDQNLSVDGIAYRQRLKSLPEAARRSWLNLEWVTEGVYFADFKKAKEDGSPWHVIQHVPRAKDEFGQMVPFYELPWMKIYRALDWGYDPDPAVCLWIGVLPNKSAIVFKERHWRKTLATDVAKAIRRESEGMRVVDTFCDPSIFFTTGAVYSIGDLIEQNGIPLTKSVNDRVLYGYAIHDFLNTEIDQAPKLRIVEGEGSTYGCANLVKTIPTMRRNKTNPEALADGNDHWVVALAYFCIGDAAPSENPLKPSTPRWMMPKPRRSYNG